MTRVLVVGAGVVGLSSAIRLAEAGHEVHVLARDLPDETTSAVAAAVWYPYHAAPEDLVARWGRTAYATFVELAQHHPESGVRLRWGTELHRERRPEPSWAADIPTFTHATELPDGFVDGWRFESPVIDMSHYLRWLVRRLADLGGTITRAALSALPNQAPVVVNCTGLGSRHLADDSTLHPGRGQVVQVAPIGLEEWLIVQPLKEDGVRRCYVVPRIDDVVVGGTDESDEWDRTPDAATETDILGRATTFVPELRTATVLSRRVGLRPLRPTVRLEESASTNGHRLIHCYGHGGAGVTLSWGCAEDVVSLVNGSSRTPVH